MPKCNCNSSLKPAFCDRVKTCQLAYVESVTQGTGIAVNNADPLNPVVGLADNYLGKYTEYTPALVNNLSIGNGTLICSYARIGDMVTACVYIESAAASPTTAWQNGSGGTYVSLPLKAKRSANGSGLAAAVGTQASAAGQSQIQANYKSDIMYIAAIIPATLATANPATFAAGWGGTAAWKASGYVSFSITYITTGEPVTSAARQARRTVQTDKGDPPMYEDAE